MIKNKPTVAILMATYNGEKYISQQIDSILNQSEVNVYILIVIVYDNRMFIII